MSCALWALAALTALRLLVAAVTPLAPDEAYYWVWSRALAPGFLDHPPMVALWIRAGTLLAGAGALGVRLLAPLAAALGSVLLAQAGADLLGDRRRGVLAAVMLNATLLFGAGAVTMTPDTPLLLFWTATLWALGRLLATGHGGWWLAAGAATGLALDSKYTALLLPPAMLLWLLAVPALRPWLRRVQPWAGAVLAGAACAPVLLWNARHGWASFIRQGGRAGDWHPAAALRFLAELFGGQIGLATPLLALLFAAGMAMAARRGWRRDPAWTLLALLTLLPGAVFFQHALGDRVQANWPAVIYPAAALAAAGLGRWRWSAQAVALGAAITVLVYLQATLAPVRLPRGLDPTLARLGGWPGLAGAVAAAAAQAEAQYQAQYIAADEYGLAAELAWQLPAELPVIGVDPRWALFDLPDARAAMAGRPGLLVRSVRRDGMPFSDDWARVAPLGEVARSRGGVVAERYRLYLITGRDGTEPAARLPRPRSRREPDGAAQFR